MLKKEIIFLFLVVFFSSLILAQSYKIDIKPTQENFYNGNNITFIVNIIDSNNNLISDKVKVIFEDADKTKHIEQEINSKEISSINLGEGTSPGQGTIIAKYKDSEARGYFFIELQESAKFELIGEKLVITNIGNKKYSKKVTIAIGETVGTKNPELGIGEKVSYRLIAPEGNYKIKVIEEDKIVLIKEEVKLTWTGNVIGALDENSAKRSGITGGVSPDEKSDIAILTYMKESKFTYVFILVIFGAMVLLAIERNYQKKVNK